MSGSAPGTGVPEGRPEAGRVTGHVLGPVELAGPKGVLRPSAGKQRVLLGGLLLHAGRVVSTDELIEWLWAQTPPPTAKETLYVYLMRLRKLMQDQVGGAARLRTVPGGFRLDLPPGALDLSAYRTAVAEARRSEEDGDTTAAVDRFRAAEELWRGPALADVPSDRLQRDEVVLLTEEKNRAVEDRIELELHLGRHTALLGELRALTARYPLRERLWVLLMRALHQDGRRAEALDCYLQVRTLLLDTYGLEPGEELRGMQRHILRGGVPGPAGPGAALDPAWQIQCQLPSPPPVFVGRSDETGALAAALTPTETPGVPVALVSGPPGIGKSALAVRVAHQLRDHFPDGQWYVQLDDLAPGEHIGDLLRLSGAAPESIPASLPARAAALRARLAGRRVLLLLEDATQLDQIRPLLPSTPGCAFLVTCRRVIAGLPGAEQVRLDVLDAPDAERMFAAVAGRRAAEDRESARRIVELCGGLPLALSIAGARLVARPDTTLAAFAHRLARRKWRLDALEVDSLRLRAAVRAAYVRLTPAAQNAFRLIGLLPSNVFPSWVLSALIGPPDDEGVAEQLLRASLLNAEPDPRTGESRYRVHELLLAYAEELATAEPAAQSVEALRRLLGAFLQIAEARHPDLRPRLPLPPDDAPADQVLPQDRARRLADPRAWGPAERELAGHVIERAHRLGRPRQAARLCHLLHLTPPCFNDGSDAARRDEDGAADDRAPHPKRPGEPRATGWLLMRAARAQLERGAVAAAARSARHAWKVFTEEGELRGSAAAARLLRQIHMTL
ncbi:hypothetical protein GCM10010430_62990 [Kitasatospora cystarginea]|uniref:OmpR/PhoB-type domain-containing protein n=1 Tax=Kitasatospora cystarginea TaxID=58350 RepID=A0ABN3ESZ7_9ACTN